jgi:hypothetical protein
VLNGALFAIQGFVFASLPSPLANLGRAAGAYLRFLLSFDYVSFNYV